MGTCLTSTECSTEKAVAFCSYCQGTVAVVVVVVVLVISPEGFESFEGCRARHGMNREGLSGFWMPHLRQGNTNGREAPGTHERCMKCGV